MDEPSKPEKLKTTKVGYCNPPEHTRFRTGQSGNPRGRPKGTLNMATVLERTLREKVVINENGVRRTVTKLEAAVKQLVNRAASGDLGAMRQLAALAGSPKDQVAPPTRQLAQDDQKVMEGVLKRFAGSAKGEDDENR